MVIQPEDMIGQIFLAEPFDNGERHRACIVEAISDQHNQLEKNPDCIKFLCSFNNDQYTDILAYNNIINHIEKYDDDPTIWKLHHITAHEGPLAKTPPSYKGSSYNVMIEWETGDITAEPLSIIAADDPVTCAIYAKQITYLTLTVGKGSKILPTDKRIY